MITFKRFISESSERHIPITTDLLDFIKTHCSDAMWMVENNSPLWRGSSSAKNTAQVVDPTVSQRHSVNIPNHYTVLLDNNPYMKDYPKRSRSLIAASKEYIARSYGKICAVIPFDNVPIGVVNNSDLWNVKIDIFGRKLDFETLAHTLNRLFLNPTYDKFKEFDRLLKAGDVEAKMLFNDVFSGDYDNYDIDFLNSLNVAMSPEKTGFELTDSKRAAWVGRATEVWVGGKCIVIPIEEWHKLIREIEFLGVL